jgi:lipoprotein-anchoring transpeptidase ErfK/SrfK
MRIWLTLALLTWSVTGCDRAPHRSAEAGPHPTVAEHPLMTNATSEPAPASPASPADDKLAAALALQHAGKLAEARAALLELELTEPVIAALNEIDTQLLFTPVPAPQKLDHTVAAGDTLGKLAAKYHTTVELIRKANGLKSDVIRVGDRLRIYRGQFAVEVSKTANTLTVTDAGKFFKRYRVGTGEFSKTPVGEFKIATRIENPPWYRSDGKVIPFGDPENILGTHWLGLDVPGYGIHGTWETNSIGRQASAGCVRLLNGDVAELYTMLPLGTPVSIHD